MPSYDFTCNKCDHEFELFLPRFIREEDKVCPECGATDLKQTLTGFNMSIGCGASGRGNTGPRMDGKPPVSQKYTKYRDSKYRKK